MSFNTMAYWLTLYTFKETKKVVPLYIQCLYKCDVISKFLSDFYLTPRTFLVDASSVSPETEVALVMIYGAPYSYVNFIFDCRHWNDKGNVNSLLSAAVLAKFLFLPTGDWIGWIILMEMGRKPFPASCRTSKQNGIFIFRRSLPFSPDETGRNPLHRPHFQMFRRTMDDQNSCTSSITSTRWVLIFLFVWMDAGYTTALFPVFYF